MVALTQVAAPQAPKPMSKYFGFAAALMLSVVLPTAAQAAGIVFEGAAGGWKTANIPASSIGGQGYWDQRSYDSLANTPTGACGAGTLVAGLPCDWARPAVSALTNPRAITPGVPFEYAGLTSPVAGGSDAALNFFFTGPFDFDWAVLFQLTDWADTVEFGWYPANAPDTRNPIVGPGGPYTTNDGRVGVTGRADIPTGDFGFYYRNTRYGATPSTEIVFFTQSKFNKVGNYFAYFSDPESGIWATPSRTDDEMTFRTTFDNARGHQQFVAFKQGNTYWLGLEDQFGRVNPAFCYNAQDQPCSDYDFNDFIINFVERATRCVGDGCDEITVPEPATLTLLGAGLFAAAWMRRRRR